CLILLACSPTPEQAAKDRSALVYVTNESDGTISVIDPDDARVVATIAVGKRPRGIRISPDGARLYVALSGSPVAGPHIDESSLPPADKAADGIGVIDLSTRRLLAIHRGVSDPEQLAITPDGSTLFVASEDTGQAFVVDAHQGVHRAALEVGEEPEG